MTGLKQVRRADKALHGKTFLDNYQAIAHHSHVHVKDAPILFSPKWGSHWGEKRFSTRIPPPLAVSLLWAVEPPESNAFVLLEADIRGYLPSQVLHWPHQMVSFFVSLPRCAYTLAVFIYFSFNLYTLPNCCEGGFNFSSVGSMTLPGWTLSRSRVGPSLALSCRPPSLAFPLPPLCLSPQAWRYQYTWFSVNF